MSNSESPASSEESLQSPLQIPKRTNQRQKVRVSNLFGLLVLCWAHLGPSWGVSNVVSGTGEVESKAMGECEGMAIIKTSDKEFCYYLYGPIVTASQNHPQVVTVYLRYRSDPSELYSSTRILMSAQLLDGGPGQSMEPQPDLDPH